MNTSRLDNCTKDRLVLGIIGFDDSKIIKDFIRLHVENLDGTKMTLGGTYPNYILDGINIRKQNDQPSLLRRIIGFLPYHIISRYYSYRTNNSKISRRSLAKGFRKLGIDAILAEFGDAAATVSPLAADLNIPLLAHFHGHDAHRLSLLTPELRNQYEKMFNTASAVFVVSRYMHQTLTTLGCPQHKLIYNPYGPRDKFLDIQPDYQPTVLSVGRFTDIKANYLVLLAFQEALKKVPHAKLVMIGDGELLETCKTIAKALKISRQVEFLGAIEHSKIHEYFKKACCFAQHSVSPSYGDAEGTPNTVIEASAAGLPVVSTYHAGIPDIVQHNTTGFLVPELDVESMGQYLAQLLSDRQLCESMGRKGKNRIRQHFTSSKHIDRINLAIKLSRARDTAGIADLARESLEIGKDRN